MAGLVSLVGGGPGDPGLVTRKGLDRLRHADVVVYDRLAPPALLREAPPGARLVDVGKAPGRVEMAQADINALLVEEGKAGRRVVRLKGGDPFVFGRGGEEALALAQAGVPFEVVPGVTSAVGAPAYAGIPVTHRGMATAVTFVTGHEDPDKGGERTDWEALARTGGTLCILMGVGRLDWIVHELLEGGRPTYEPVAAVTWGTTGRQRVMRSTLAALPEAGVEPPAVIVVGSVAGLADELSWFAPGPLAGRTIVVTRAREKASALRARLEELGADVVEVPTIAFTEPSDPSVLAGAVAGLDRYAWALFTSPTGVERTMDAVRAAGGDARWFAGVSIAAVGPETAAALAWRGLVADLIPPEAVAESLADVFPAGSGRVAFFRAEEGRDVLPDRLGAKGWTVEVVPAYRTVMGGAAALPERFDAVTFTSSSTVRNFMELVPETLPPSVVACIGPVTAQTAEEFGWKPAIVASEHTIDGLVAALSEFFSSEASGA